MTEMIEKCARAVASRLGHNPDECVHGSGGTGVESVCHIRRWEQYAPVAAAVIDAMMEPTPEMEHAALLASRACTDLPGGIKPLPIGYDGWSAAFVFRAMLSKAKSE